MVPETKCKATLPINGQCDFIEHHSKARVAMLGMPISAS